MEKWKTTQTFRAFPYQQAIALYAKAHMESNPVQITFSHQEAKLLKSLARGAGRDEWVSEQDSLSSYWVNLLIRCGEPITKVINTINYRSFFSTGDFPPNLPNLCANVSGFFPTILPPLTTSSTSKSPLSLSPIALALRTIVVPIEGECLVISNWRYDCNVPFGFPVGTTQFHTWKNTVNALWVFRSNRKEGGTECSWQMRDGKAAKVLEEVAKDRNDGWAR